ncbi:MAG: M55 family metallopeptidase [Thermoplasmata archaeon]
MKVLISSDAEGAGWVTHGSQVLPDGRDYNHFREVYTLQINALAQGALENGASEIYLADSHDSGRNIIYERMHPSLRLITGTPRPLSMVQGVDLTDSIFLFGYHSMAGSRYGVLNHTYSTSVHRLRINGREIGEIGLSAAIAGKFGKPVKLVAGDSAAIEEAREILEECEFVVLKEGIMRYSSIALSLEKTIALLREGAGRAMHKKGGLFRISEPVRMEIEFNSTGMADYASLIPVFERLDGYTVSIKADDIVDAYRYFRAAVALASGDHGGY